MCSWQSAYVGIQAWVFIKNIYLFHKLLWATCFTADWKFWRVLENNSSCIRGGMGRVCFLDWERAWEWRLCRLHPPRYFSPATNSNCEHIWACASSLLCYNKEISFPQTTKWTKSWYSCFSGLPIKPGCLFIYFVLRVGRQTFSILVTLFLLSSQYLLNTYSTITNTKQTSHKSSKP